MSKKKQSIPTRSFIRGLSASLAGVRAGGAIALEGARQKLTGSAEDSSFARSEAKRFADELGRLKGSYVKIGQMLALFGEHFLPPVLAEALHELEDNTQPVPWDELEDTVHYELGENYDLLDIDPLPLAAASLAQVHRARIKSSGEEICLKIQFPDLDRVIDADFDGVIRMLKTARWLKAGRELDTWLNQLREQLHNEINYHREAEITELMHSTVAKYGLDQPQKLEFTSAAGQVIAAVAVPKVYRQFSTRCILALEYSSGTSIKHPDVHQLPLQTRNELSLAMLRLFFYEVFEWKVMQTDPNFGNYLVERSSHKSNTQRLFLLDFGSSLELSKGQSDNLRLVITAGLSRDKIGVERGLRGLGWLSEKATPEAIDLFVRFCYQLLEPLRPVQEQDQEHLNASNEYLWSDSELLTRVGKKGLANAATRHFELPAKDFSLFARKLTGVFTFIAYLEAEFNAYDAIEEFLIVD